MKNILFSIALIAFAVVACNTTKKSDKNMTSINDSVWELTQLEGTEVNQSGDAGKKIHFSLNSVDNAIHGYTGCNIFNGNYTLENGDRIKFSRLASTKMACPNADVNESKVLKVFELADNYTIKDDKLMLNEGKRAPLAVFKKVSSESLIVGKYWKLKTLEGKEVEMAENQEREIYFTLKANDNSVTGFAGCNTLNGTYSLEEGNRIRFSHMAITLKACPDVEVNESEFLKVFELADNYTINGDMLMLNVGKRAPLAVFEAVYFD